MDYHVHFRVNANIFLKDPEHSELGKRIVKHAIDLMYELGYEQFTFKKLAQEIQTTEATVYRYFENKHRLLLYILNWYWCYMEYLVDMKLQHITSKRDKLEMILTLLTEELSGSSGEYDYNKKYLNKIVIRESSKVYLVRDVQEINKEEVFKPYKDLCARIAQIISDYNKSYKFPRSLSTTLIETSHDQQYFSENLPRLTDANPKRKENFTFIFLKDLLFKVLG